MTTDVPGSSQKHNPLFVSEKMRRQIAGAVAEIDLEQMAIISQMTPAERVRQAAAMIEAAERVGVYRLRQRRPDLSEDEAWRIIRGGLLNYERKLRAWPKIESGS